ncbi:hypothetical protein GCM10017559_64450 [Streptosporangium longisporum]|uniref:Uncharacterized protein n=1 Tax=Streptosporangium longisporum TaxID=46187 RepID=A0ABP6L0U4_9ACTN
MLAHPTDTRCARAGQPYAPAQPPGPVLDRHPSTPCLRQRAYPLIKSDDDDAALLPNRHNFRHPDTPARRTAFTAYRGQRRLTPPAASLAMRRRSPEDNSAYLHTPSATCPHARAT